MLHDNGPIIIIIIIIITQFLTRHMSVKVWRNRRRVLDKDVETTVHKQEVICHTAI